MKCPKCGADIPEGKFYCEKCGEALQIVPDYNPAEDITIGEEDNNIQNKDSSDVSSGEQRSDRKQRFFYLLKKYGPFAMVLSIAGIITYWTSYQSTFHQDAVTEVAEELESETEQLLEVPSLSLPPGTYGDSIDLVISHDQRSQGLIYYTTDGSTPGEVSRIYNQPVHIDEGTTVVRAVFISNDGLRSEEAGGTYKIVLDYPSEPQFSVNGGDYDSGFYVTITADRESTVYYTTNGEEPDVYSKVYREPIYINPGLTVLQAVAVNKEGRASGIMEEIYNVAEIEAPEDGTGAAEPGAETVPTGELPVQTDPAAVPVQ